MLLFNAFENWKSLCINNKRRNYIKRWWEMSVKLDDGYQTEAYEIIKKWIEETKKAGIILPTGTGKTYLALKLIKVAYELKISEAVARGILKLPIYVTLRYIFEEDIRSVEEKLEGIEDEKEKEKLSKKLQKNKKAVRKCTRFKRNIKKHIYMENK